jgi:hypothetical protein
MDNKMAVNEKQEYSVFTVCNLAYLPKALVLANSILKHNNIKLKIFIFDRKNSFNFPAIEAEYYWIEDLGIPNFYQIAFKYDIVELSTSLKPYLTLMLLEKYNKVIFFDPDVCLYDSVASILDDLEHHSIILTPHYTTPLSNHKKPGWNNDVGIMRFGSFNLGFYAAKNSPQGSDFLKWWSDRCLRLCFMESQFGLSTDQKWVTIAPSFFQDLHISFNLGYNVAPWNIFERCIKKIDNECYIINDIYPLVFFHFSNFDNADLDYSNEQSNYGGNIYCPELFELGTAYMESLSLMKKEVPFIEYTFDYMSGGEYISPTLRRAYACILNELPAIHDPFDSNGLVGKFARGNYLFEKKTKVESKKSIGFRDFEAHKTKFKYIYILMRIILRLIGPNKFQDLSRLMVYLSSYRQNRGLWKYL